MIPCRPNQQPQANAAAPRAGSGQLAHASPEVLFWHFVCDEICEVLCEVLCVPVCVSDEPESVPPCCATGFNP